MSTWTRPHPLPLGRVVARAYTALLACALAGILAALSYTGTALAAPLALLAVAAAAALVLAGRASTVGLFVSDHGVRVRTLTRTTTWQWADLADVHSALGRGTQPPRETLWLVPATGPAVPAPVCRAARAVLLTDFSLDSLPAARFDEVVGHLRERLRQPDAVPQVVAR